MLSLAGEFGGMSYLRHDYEYYCSGKFFYNNYKKSGEEFYNLALQGDLHALEVFQEYGQHIGDVIKAVLYAMGPQAIFLGGSASKSFEFFKDAMWDSVSEFPHKPITNKLVIEKSSLEKPGILGAAALVQYNSNPSYLRTMEYEKN
jgi:glucokinase